MYQHSGVRAVAEMYTGIMGHRGGGDPRRSFQTSKKGKFRKKQMSLFCLEQIIMERRRKQ